VGLEDFATRIGAYIDKRDADQFMGGMKRRALSRDDPRVGFVIESFEDVKYQQRMKKEFGLEVNVYRPSSISDPSDLGRYFNDVSKFLSDKIDSGYDVAMNFHWKPLRGTENGHYVLVAAYDDKNHDVYVADPSPYSPDFWKLDLETFLHAMKPIWDEPKKDRRERGFITFGPPYRDENKTDQNLLSYKQVPLYSPVIIVPHRMKPNMSKIRELRKMRFDFADDKSSPQ